MFVAIVTHSNKQYLISAVSHIYYTAQSTLSETKKEKEMEKMDARR